MRKQFIIITVCTNLLLIVLTLSLSNYFIIGFILTLPITVLGFYDMYQTRHTLMRNYPIFGRGRFIMEELRPKIYQYFIESDTDGTPISRIFRSIVYQRSKRELSTTPFGTQLNVDDVGYEWLNHSMAPLDLHDVKPETLRINVGGKDCKRPYSCSIFNISAMSYGALSSAAIESLNWGAKEGNFAHNTGEGGISPFHLKHGGDLIWQIGTGYFGCRDEEGHFNSEAFREKASLENVKMIEIKLSQGAKPGHGGILPAEKNTDEIAQIRGVKPGTSVNSPSRHTAFDGFIGMVEFIKKLRELSDGKPIGIKLCFGNPLEFEELCQQMVKMEIYPDYIAIDGGEGGTGAAPLEFSNSIGMSLTDGIIFAKNLLDKYDLSKNIKLFASGKILTGFQIVRALALGADACYCARGMMLSLGCIQALECNSNHCPTGVATQNPELVKGLVVTDKYKRVFNFHRATIESVSEIMAAAGILNLENINRGLIWRRVSESNIKSYEDLFPSYRAR